MLALFTDETGRVRGIHHQSERLDAAKRKRAALILEALPPPPALPVDAGKYDQQVMYVVDGKLEWHLETREPNPEDKQMDVLERIEARLMAIEALLSQFAATL